MRKQIVSFIFLGFIFSSTALALDWAGMLGINKKATLGSTQIGQGLKEALRTGINRAIEITGKPNGYFSNPSIKIPMPEKLKSLEGALRKVGLGSKIDELVLSMNRAAESAAPQARDIFIDAIAEMSIEDAEALLKGGDHSATEYFRKKTSDQLMAAYKPVVIETMSKYQVTSQYQTIIKKYQATALASKFPAPNIEDYTVKKSLDGLFLILGEQEKQIRQNPAARTTELLQKVFGPSR